MKTLVFTLLSYTLALAGMSSSTRAAEDPLRRGGADIAFLTDSSNKGPNGFLIVDLASGRSWRLHDHPTTKADPTMLVLVEGRPVMERPPGGMPKPVTMGSDGIAIAHDGSRLYYCPPVGRRLYSVSIDSLVDPRLSDAQVAASVLDHSQKGSSDGRRRATVIPHTTSRRSPFAAVRFASLFNVQRNPRSRRVPDRSRVLGRGSSSGEALSEEESL